MFISVNDLITIQFTQAKYFLQFGLEYEQSKGVKKCTIQIYQLSFSELNSLESTESIEFVEDYFK